ncbi:hypothetical protein [Rhodopseudomonas sp.]|uniref:hypothetical protein n=1 Tax=Rhodopseudomonas sp. TaxID=1078 RepID=UPI0039E71B31
MLQSAHEAMKLETFGVEPDAKFELGNYTFAAASADGIAAYQSIVEDAYLPLEFINEHAGYFLPRAGTKRYALSSPARIS